MVIKLVETFIRHDPEPTVSVYLFRHPYIGRTSLCCSMVDFGKMPREGGGV